MIIQDLPGKSKMTHFHKIGFLLAAVAAFQLSGCSSVAPRAERPATAAKPIKGGGYYLDDGPGDNPPANLDAIPDAEPKLEPLHKFANRPYTVLGQTYTPATQLGPYKARGIASWYGRRYHGQKTAVGDTYDMYTMSAAHPTLPIPSYARVTNLSNGKSVVVRINDRGPFHSNRLIDLSYTAAYKLGVLNGGTNQVEVESIDPANYQVAAGKPAVNAPAAGPVPLQPTPVAVAQPLAPPAEKVAALPAVPPATGADGSVFLQLGAFSSRENAENFSGKMKLGLGQLVEKIQIVDAGGLFRVRLGPYASRAEASQVAGQIGQAANISPVIAR